MEVAMLAGRIARKVGIDRNPLRRRTDRVEAWITVALMAAVALAGPFLIWHAGEVAYRGAVSASERDNARLRFKVNAVLLEDPDGDVSSDNVRSRHVATARWTAPDGTPRTGPVLVPASEGASVSSRSSGSAGKVIVVTTDVHGIPMEAPAPSDPASMAFLGGFAASLGLTASVMCIRLLIRRRLDTLRMARWQTEWRLVEPIWSGRHRRRSAD
jgi:hypothetical protein